MSSQVIQLTFVINLPAFQPFALLVVTQAKNFDFINKTSVVANDLFYQPATENFQTPTVFLEVMFTAVQSANQSHRAK